MRALAAVLVLLALILPAKPGTPIFCNLHPTHPKCIPSPTPTPTAAPTATPTAAPTPTPTPVPTPTPAPNRPFAAPVTTRTVNVPSSIDSSGNTEVGAALRSFIASVPDGSIIAFPAGGRYRVDVGIWFSARHHLVFDGNGATILSTAPDDTSAKNSAFALWGSDTDIVIRDFTIIGQNTLSAVYRGATNENRYGILVWGGARVEIDNVTMRDIWADFVTLGGQLPTSGSDMIESDNVWVHDSSFTGSGRMGVSVTASTHDLIERTTFDLTAWSTLDVEPNTFDNEAGWITFRDNRILRGHGTPETAYDPEFVSARNALDTPNVHDITITGNETDQTLRTDIDNPNRRRNIVFTDNIAHKPAPGPVVVFAHIDGLTYHGNVQPLTSGPLYSVTDCTNVTTN